MRFHFYTTLSFIATGALILGLCAPIVFAESVFSPNFMAFNTIINEFGGTGSSTSFFSILAGGGNTAVTGEASSTNFLISSGPLYYDSFTPQSQNWRWYGDITNETPVSPLALENVAPSNIANQQSMKLRMTVGEVADIGLRNVKFAVQYSTVSDFSSGVHAAVERGSCTGSSGWCYENGIDTDNATITTALLSDAGPCVAAVGTGCGSHNESGVSTSTLEHTKSSAREYEFTIKQAGASPGVVYFFRLLDVASLRAVPLATGASYPSVVTGGTELTVSVGGIASSTLVAGITTSVDTTATSIAFGRLPAGVSVTGAQLFTVSTNAGTGYKIFTLQRQGLLDSGGGEINPVTGTNASPSGWSTGCTAVTGCYGYHPTADVLSGGSTRFAANDTYAGFDSTPSEMAYQSGPSVNATTSVVYRVEARGLQEAGDYSSEVDYIVVPVF